MSNLAISERELFSSLIVPDDISHLPQDEKKALHRNINKMTTGLSRNIFTNEYYAFFETIKVAKKYNIILSYKNFNQILLNNIETLVNSEQVIIEEFATDPRDEELVKEEYLNNCCTLYQELSQEPLDSERFSLNLQLYLENWVSVELNKCFMESYQINTKGLTIRGKFLQGAVEADIYYRTISAELNKMLNINERTLPKIDITPEGYAHYRELKDDSEEIVGVARLGIESIDDEIGSLGRGDVAVIMGPTGGGKTRVTSNIAYNSIIDGKHGVWFALEGHPREATSLLIARHLVEKYDIDFISSTDIYEKKYDPKYHEIVESAEQDLFNNEDYGKVTVLPAPLLEEELESKLDDIWETEFNFDWVVVDHTSLIQSRTKQSKTEILEEFMPNVEVMAQGFKGVGFLLLLPHQLKQKTIDDLARGEDTTLTGSADSASVMRSATVALTIYTDEELKAVDKAQIICTKTRHSEGFSKTEVFARLAVCKFEDLPS